MNERGKISGWYSWPVIILALCVFWPVGLFLIIRRFTLDRKSAMRAGGIGLNGLGIGLVIFGAIGFIGCISDTSGDSVGGAIVALFFIAGGVALILKAKKIKKDAENVRKYLSVIVNGSQRQIDVIAASLGKSYDVAKNDIQNMINKGYLKNAYINEGTREIVLPNANVQAQVDMMTSANNDSTNMTTRIVACSCCGANNTIAGDVGECEYCGSSLK